MSETTILASLRSDPFLRKADLVVANLETPFTDSREVIARR
jgi:hypothetical protein